MEFKVKHLVALLFCLPTVFLIASAVPVAILSHDMQQARDILITAYLGMMTPIACIYVMAGCMSLLLAQWGSSRLEHISAENAILDALESDDNDIDVDIDPHQYN